MAKLHLRNVTCEQLSRLVQSSLRKLYLNRNLTVSRLLKLDLCFCIAMDTLHLPRNSKNYAFQQLRPQQL